MNRRIRIKDIADRVGVSTGTVDRVLHNRGKVAPDVKERVLAVMESMGYERNLIASALAYNRTWNIVALMPDHRHDPYWQQPYEGIQRATRSVKHYGVNLDHHSFDFFNAQDFVKKAEAILENPPDALLFAPIFLKESQELLQACEAKGIPTLTINTFIENAPYLAYIGQDSYQSGVLAGRLLHFGLNSGESAAILNLDVASHNAQHLIDKEKGFRNYFAQYPEQAVEIIKVDFEDFMDKRKLRKFMETLLAKHPRLHGIFFTNSRAYKAIDVMPEAIAQRLKIVGFDLIPQNLAHLQRNNIDFLINQNPAEQGYLGIINLFNQLLKHQPVKRIQHLPLDIVVKENVYYYLHLQKELVV